jgi:hypothetical protein
VQGGPEGERAAFGDQEAEGGDTECGVVVEAAPPTPFLIAKTKLLLEFLIIALDPPAWKAIFGRLGLALRPLDQQPLLGGARLGSARQVSRCAGRTRRRAKRDASQSELGIARLGEARHGRGSLAKPVRARPRIACHGEARPASEGRHSSALLCLAVKAQRCEGGEARLGMARHSSAMPAKPEAGLVNSITSSFPASLPVPQRKR